jgi:luciferase family oxidoreductase group 1
MSEFRMGALDFSRLAEGVSATDAVWETLELAPLLESFGYQRFWLGEHHTRDVGHSSPELLVPVLAGLTSRMKIGTAGVLLRFYSPFKVASNFRLLQTIYPGRIDLGIARGFAEQTVAQLLLEGRADEVPYARKVSELMRFLRGQGERPAKPHGVAPPEVWILGSQTTSMQLACDNGVGFCLALFLDETPDEITAGIIKQYRESFRARPELPEPRWCIAVAGVCAETEGQARAHASEAVGVFPNVVGDPRQCRAAFEKLAEVFETREFIFLDVCKKFDDRVLSYKLLAEGLGLPRPD